MLITLSNRISHALLICTERYGALNITTNSFVDVNSYFYIKLQALVFQPEGESMTDGIGKNCRGGREGRERVGMEGRS